MLKWFGDKIIKEQRQAQEKALYEISGALLTRANKTCPHDYGTLEGSGKNTPGEKPHETWFVSYDTDYAVPVHEGTDMNFRGNGRAKWLEKTAKEMSSSLEQHAARVIQRELSY